jgi:hypothetical protein
MKKMILTLMLLVSANIFASDLRSQCENAYYANAGGVTKLHQYRVIVNWGKLSDSQLVQFENLIYSEDAPLSILSETSWDSRSGNLMSTFIVKESNGYDGRDYALSLKKLEQFSAVTVGCK